MELEFKYDRAIAGTELTINGEVTGNINFTVKLSGHKAYEFSGGYSSWEYIYGFAFCYNKQNYILMYQACAYGDGWFLEEAHEANLNTNSPILFHGVRDREKGRWSSVDLLAEHIVIDQILGENRPKHCRGY